MNDKNNIYKRREDSNKNVEYSRYNKHEYNKHEYNKHEYNKHEFKTHEGHKMIYTKYEHSNNKNLQQK